jgi:phosphoribosyl-AMP cyclohydrolase
LDGVNIVEEGTDATIQFGKIQLAAESAHPLVPVVLQHAETKDVLFVGYANAEALAETFQSGQATLWSSSRDELWRKGATSGDVLDVVEVRVNCEQNSLVYLVKPRRGAVCHTADANGPTRRTCYYRRLVDTRRLTFLEGFSPSP